MVRSSPKLCEERRRCQTTLDGTEGRRLLTSHHFRKPSTPLVSLRPMPLTTSFFRFPPGMKTLLRTLKAEDDTLLVRSRKMFCDFFLPRVNALIGAAGASIIEPISDCCDGEENVFELRVVDCEAAETRECFEGEASLVAGMLPAPSFEDARPRLRLNGGRKRSFDIFPEALASSTTPDVNVAVDAEEGLGLSTYVAVEGDTADNKLVSLYRDAFGVTGLSGRLLFTVRNALGVSGSGELMKFSGIGDLRNAVFFGVCGGVTGSAIGIMDTGR